MPQTRQDLAALIGAQGDTPDINAPVDTSQAYPQALVAPSDREALARFVAGGPAPMEPTLQQYQQGAEYEPGQTRRPSVLPITRDAQTGEMMLAMPKWAEIAGLVLPSAAGALGPSSRAINSLSGNENLASRVVPGYDLVPRGPRSLADDYPASRWPDVSQYADETGRLTHDMEGRPLNPGAVIVGRSSTGAPDIPVPQVQLDPLTKAITGNQPVGATRSFLGKDAGRFATEYDPLTGEAKYTSYFDRSLPPAAQDRVIAHELGHAIDRFSSPSPKAKGESLNALYNETNNGDFVDAYRATGDIEKALARSSKARGYTPKSAGYPEDERPKELMAEAIRAYMGNPEAMKQGYPGIAANIRKAVNSHPDLSQHIQFNGGAPLPSWPSDDR